MAYLIEIRPADPGSNSSEGAQLNEDEFEGVIRGESSDFGIAATWLACIGLLDSATVAQLNAASIFVLFLAQDWANGDYVAAGSP